MGRSNLSNIIVMVLLPFAGQISAKLYEHLIDVKEDLDKLPHAATRPARCRLCQRERIHQSSIGPASGAAQRAAHRLPTVLFCVV